MLGWLVDWLVGWLVGWLGWGFCYNSADESREC